MLSCAVTVVLNRTTVNADDDIAGTEIPDERVLYSFVLLNHICFARHCNVCKTSHLSCLMCTRHRTSELASSATATAYKSHQHVWSNICQCGHKGYIQQVLILFECQLT